MKNKLKIDVFANAFTYTSRTPLKLSEEVLGRIEPEYPTASYEFVAENEILVPAIYDRTLAVFEHSFDNVEVFLIRKHDVVETFTSDEEGFKDIDKETYEKLSPNFKKKYRAVPSGVSETREPVEFDIRARESIVFDEERFLGAKVSELEKLIYGNDYSPKPGLRSLGRTVPSVRTVLQLLKGMYDQEKRELTRVRADFKISSESLRGSYDDSADYLSVEYLTAPFSGAQKKVYLRKKNMQLYADRRHRLVDDVPEVASRVVIRSQDLREMLSLSTDDDETLAAIRALYRAIFRPA